MMFFHWRNHIFWVALSTIIVAGALLYSFYEGRRMAQRYAPLVDAAMEIKLEATTAHLWFEEIISGDRFIGIEIVWKHLDQAEWYARAMLDGGENSEGKFLPLEDVNLRLGVQETYRGLTAFRKIAEKRWKSKETSGVSSSIDQYFDRIFDNFLISADTVETSLQRKMKDNLQLFGLLQGGLIVLTIILGVLTGGLMQRNGRLLKESEQRFHDFANMSADWFWQMDEKLQFTEISGQHFQTTSWVNENIIGKTRDQFANDEENISGRKWQKHLAVLEAHKPFKNFEFRTIGERGNNWVSVTGTPLFDRDGIFRGYRGTAVNISERKRIEQRMEEAKEMAEHASQSKSDFLANISHEIRTPLTAIIGFSDMMRSEVYGPIGEPHYEAYAKDISTSANHLLDVINDLLDMSKIEAGKIDLQETPTNIDTLIDFCMETISEVASSEHLTLVRDVSNELPPLLCDERLIKQVLLNLLSNAIKFTQEDGTITVNSSLSENNQIMLSVSDNGPGINRKDIEKVMEPFSQLADPMLRKQRGTGLGLPLSKMMVDLHGGTFEIESDIGQGTTVIATFPSERTVGVS